MAFYNSVMTRLTYTRAQQLPALLETRILVLDGAMGTMIQRFKLDETQYRGQRFKDFHKDVKGNNELLSLTRPDVITDIHERYLAAGADMIETNTFGATRIAQADYDMADLAFEMNLVSARLARAACDKFSTSDKPRFVLGALGPTPKTASISPDVNDPGARNVSFEELRASYYEQVEALVQGGADVLLVETIFDTLNAKAAPDTFISCYPNAGLPNPMSDTGFDETPEVTSRLVGEFAADGLVNIVGGCCGTTPAHIGAIHDKVAPMAGRTLQKNVFYKEAA